MKKTLITGASGFIGRHALALLLQAGHEVHAVSFKKKQKKETLWVERPPQKMWQDW